MDLKHEITQTAFIDGQSEDKEQEFPLASLDRRDESVMSCGEFDDCDDLSNDSMFSVNTVVTRIESRPFKGIPKEWHETI